MEYTQTNKEKKHEVAGKMKFTMNAVTPKSKSRGMRYAQKGGAVKQPHSTMNASVPGGRAGMKPKQAGKGLEHTRGEKAKQSNPQANFSTTYTQHGKRE